MASVELSGSAPSSDSGQWATYWKTIGGSKGGGGDWGAFTPNLPVLSMEPAWGSYGTDYQSSGYYSQSGSFGSGYASSLGSGGYGSSFTRSDPFVPVSDGFTNSDPLGGTSTASYESIKTLDTVTATAPKPDQMRAAIASLFNQPYDYRAIETPYDPTVQDLGTRVTAVRPDPEPGTITEDQLREKIGQDQRRILEYFTGPFGEAYSLVKSLVSGDWWGAAWTGVGLAGLGPILRIGGKAIRNSRLAGDVHPSGIPFKKTGFPDFSSVAIKEVKINQTGIRSVDFAAANRAAGLDSTPRGYTWHHVEDGKTMQLVPTDIHKQTGHTGGVALHGRNR